MCKEGCKELEHLKNAWLKQAVTTGDMAKEILSLKDRVIVLEYEMYKMKKSKPMETVENGERTNPDGQDNGGESLNPG